jgi:hypothetical protein
MNLAHYCLVEAGAIAAGPCSLPDKWRGHQGLKHMDDETLAALGWLPVVDTEDEATEHGDAVLTVEDGRVRRHRPSASPVVPQEVTMRQARLALLGAGLLPGVDAAIESLDEPHRTAARIEWEYAQAVERYSPLTEMLGSALGLTSESIDALFFAADGR